MQKLLALGFSIGASIGLAHVASAAQLIYEPFDYTAGSVIVPGNISINSGNGLVDSYNTPSTKWVEAGTVTPGSTPHQITSPGLVAPTGLPAAIGNAATMEGGSAPHADFGEFARMDLPGGPYGPSAVTYYSLLLNVTDITGLTTPNSNVNAANDLIISFSNASGAQSARPSIFAGELTIRLGTDASHFNLGIRSSTTAAGTTFFSGDLSPSTTYFIVGRFTEGAVAGGPGSSDLWINPASATFGAAIAPSPTGSTAGTFSTTGTNDHTNSIIIGAGIAAGANPNTTAIDELRVGTTWADVTPEPASLGLISIGALGLLRPRRSS